ncbi:uncharacterized protein [Brachyistius frenatus]|uniref:uncharacterized protein n=1 Tax=Brachyistius frenatus TaxID=100188 RepID=UPI0037E8B6AD
MLLCCWSVMLICLSAYSESTVMYKESGKNITLRCSSEECPERINDYVGMYLFHEFVEEKEVIFYKDKLMERTGYKSRIQINRYQNHTITITISNLTADDSGVYTCVYTNTMINQVRCNSAIVFIRGVTPCSKPEEVPGTSAEESGPPLVLIVTAACAISSLVSIIFMLLIILRVKQSTRSRGRRSAPQESNDYVYEVMNMNGSSTAVINRPI